MDQQRSVLPSFRQRLPACAGVLLGGIALNLLLGELVLRPGLPLYLDSLGTVLSAIFCGSWIGALCGAASALLWELWRPGMAYWAITGAAIGLVAGWCARVGLFRHWATALLAGGIIAGTATLVSVPIRLFLHGATTTGEGVLSELLIRAGKDVWEAIISSSYLVELTDKLSVCLLARFAALGLLRAAAPLRTPTALRRLHEPDATTVPSLAVFGGFLCAGGLYVWFFLSEIVSPTPGAYDQSAHDAFLALCQGGFGGILSLAATWAPATAVVGGVCLLVGLLFRL